VAVDADGSVILAGDGSAFGTGKLFLSNDGGSTWGEECPTGSCISANWYAASTNNDGSRLFVSMGYEGYTGYQEPTMVELLSFTGTALEEGPSVLLEWETAAEVDCLGFRLWRAEAGAGYQVITPEPIPCEGDVSQGASYAFEDRGVVPGASYLYQLEDLDVHGASTLHGPVSVDVPGLAAWGPPEAEASGAASSSSGTASGGVGSLLCLLVPACAVLVWRWRRAFSRRG